MQYRGYEIQITQDGAIIRNSSGKIIGYPSTEEDAREYIDNVLQESEDTKLDISKKRKENSNKWNDDFEDFCKSRRLQPIVYIDGKHMYTQNEGRLRTLINEFEKKFGVRMRYETLYIDGEYFYKVCDYNDN